MTDKPLITYDRLREVLDYCPETGVFTWKVTLSATGVAGSLAGSRHSEGYSNIRIDKKRYFAHRLAWFYVTGESPRQEIDHIDGDRGNDTFYNLREATRGQNQCNRPAQSNNKSGHKGVSWNRKAMTWYAFIRLNGSGKFLGAFPNLEDAAQAYADAVRKYHGEFARLR
jgi:hypothetical protein